MTNKQKDRITVCLLAVFLAVFGLWGALRPADEMSVSERRPLAQRPVLSVESVLSGKFMQQSELYAADQFPLRESWRTLKAMTAFGVFRQKDNNDVYLADGFAAQLDYPLDESSLSYAAQRFAYLYERYLAGADAKVYLSVIPDKNCLLAEENGYPSLDLDALVESLRAQTDGMMTYIDIADLLEPDDFYRTDSHWRQECIRDVAQRLGEAMGTDVSASYTQQTLDKPYYGVYYGYAALPMEADTLHYLTSETLESCTVYHYESDTVSSGVYDLEKGNGKDPYELFLSGSESLLRVENPNAASGRELVIFRDSFASSLAPLLVEGYAAVTLVDIRYLPAEFMGSYVDFAGKDVLFLYSVPVLNNSETLK